ncbi:hypothetical protein HG531_010440 [Fusarium graminearum]|nr:hypothetical protein HG531_010440 [Fusarium graminearum]
MHISDDFNMLRERVQTIIRQRSRKEKRSLDISAPFNFEKNPVNLPGVSEEQLSMLREQAAASRIGIADHPGPCPIAPRSPCSTSSLFSHPALGANTLHLSFNGEELDLCALFRCPLLQEHLYSLLRLLVVLHQESQGVVATCTGDHTAVDSFDGAEGVEELCLALGLDGNITCTAHLSNLLSHSIDLLRQLRNIAGVKSSNQLLVAALQLVPKGLGVFGNNTLRHGDSILENLNIPLRLAIDKLYQGIGEASHTRLGDLVQRSWRKTSVPAGSINSCRDIEARANLALGSTVSSLGQVMQRPLSLVGINAKEILG